MDLGLTDRVYVVTGASRGLGRATAEQLLAEGARLVLCSRDEAALGDVVELADALGGDVLALSGDLSDPDLAARLCASAMARYGRLDGAMISVGGPPAGTVLEMTDDQWRSAFDSVFLAALHTVAAVVEHGTAPDLAFTCVLSTSTKSPIPGLSISNGLRPGLAMLIKQLADEHGPNGTRINGLLPGRVATARTEHLDSLSPDPAAARARSEKTIPLRRYGDPAEFGRVAAFLLSPAASYVTGSVIPVDGGSLRTL